MKAIKSYYLFTRDYEARSKYRYNSIRLYGGHPNIDAKKYFYLNKDTYKYNYGECPDYVFKSNEGYIGGVWAVPSLKNHFEGNMKGFTKDLLLYIINPADNSEFELFVLKGMYNQKSNIPNLINESLLKEITELRELRYNNVA